MKVLDELERLQEDALKNEDLRLKLLETRTGDNPLSCFCRLARSLGYDINEMNLVEGRNNYQEWYGVKLLNAFTAVIKKSGKYFVLGYVEHRTLMKETAVQKKGKEKAAPQPVF